MAKKCGKLLRRTSACLLVVVMTLTAVPMSGFVGLELPKWSEMFATKASASEYIQGNYVYTVSNGKATITDCDELISGNIVIPSTLGGYPVTSIGSYSFYNCKSLKNITIPSSVTRISHNAFENCSSLSSITIPNSVTSIGYSVFENCSGLANITIPDSVISIGENAFERCTSLKSITIPNSVTSIGEMAFVFCTSLTRIIIPKSVTSIGDGAFAACTSLKSITVSSANGKYMSINGVLFNKSNTELICYPAALLATSYEIPNSVTNIGFDAFAVCTNLKSIIIPNKVTSIGIGAFTSCINLTNITIPASVTSIGEGAFYNCSSIKNVYYAGSENDWKKVSIGTDNENLSIATIHYNTYGSGGGGSWGNSQNTNSNSSSNQSFGLDTLSITPYPQDGESLISFGMKNATVSWNSKYVTTTEKDTSIYIPKSELNGPIRITEENHRDYIIPAKVASAFSKLKTAGSFPVYMTRKNTKSKYISSVIGKKDKEDASKFVDLKHSSLECIDGETATIYVTSCGLTNPTYYISQDNTKKISSTTGEFSAVDVYNKFGFNGDIVVYAVDSDGSKTEAVKIKLSKKIRLSDSVQALEEMTTMNLLGSNGMGFQISDDFPILGGTSIDFSAFKVPIGVEINGTDVKLSFGFDFFEDKKNYETGEWEKKWKGFKDNCKSTEKILNDLDDTYKNWQKKWNSLENLKKQYSGKNIIKTGAADKDKGWTCSFLGYIEGKLTEDGKICFKEGSIMASAEFQFKYSQQTAVWVIPAYYYFELGANVSLDGKVY